MKKLLAASILCLSFSAVFGHIAGDDKDVQYNASGVQAGEDAFEYDPATNTFTCEILDQPAAASPIILLKDSTNSGETQISMNDAAGPDGVMVIAVDIAGTLTTFFTVDGILESTDFVYPVRLYDGDSHHIEFDVADLSSDVTATFPASTGTVALTTSNVATATALAANGGNCNAGELMAGVDAAGAVESCDATPAIDCTDCTNIPGGSTHTGTVTWGGTAILEAGAAFQFGDATDATVTHTYANTGTNVDIAFSTAAMAVTGALSATNLSGTNTGDEVAADLTTAGVIEIATGAETNTGTDATRAVSPDGLDDWTGSAQVTTLGTIATGTWSATDVAVAAGGTGASTLSDGNFMVGNGTGAVASAKPYISTVLESPADADNFNLLKAQYALTITDIDCIIDPADSGESVVIDVQERDATADNPATVDATITCDNDGAADDGTLANGAIDSGDWVSLDIGTVTGTVTQLTVTITYTVD